MYKNETLSSMGLSLTQNVLGSVIGGFAFYKAIKYFKGTPTTTGGKTLVVAVVIVGALIGSSIQYKIEQPKFKMS